MKNSFRAEMENTDNPRVYNRARKRYLENEGLISCSLCPYHKWENAHKLQKNWKRYRKTKYKLEWRLS